MAACNGEYGTIWLIGDTGRYETVDGMYGGKKGGKGLLQLVWLAHRLDDAAGYLTL